MYQMIYRISINLYRYEYRIEKKLTGTQPYCTPKTTVSSMVSRKTHVLEYHLYRETQYFHLHRETIFPLREIPETLFKRYPSIPSHEGGESPKPFPSLSLRVLKRPFRALSPCPIQILAGALIKYMGKGPFGGRWIVQV